MPVTVQVKLGDVTYTVPRMNIGQLERLTELPQGTTKAAFGALRIAFERAEPQVDFDTIEATREEITDAASAILGMSRRETAPGEPRPPETPPSSGGDIGTMSSAG